MNASRRDRLHTFGKGASDQRSEFQRDRDRILYSEAFRRLQGVTQVVSAEEGFVVHNRLTHSLKVAQVSRRIAERFLEDESIPLGLIEALGGLDAEVCEAAGLAHDLGHPPFGHVAEETLQHLTNSYDHFEGNAQSFRILTKIEPHDDRYRGLNLTRATLGAVTKYPYCRTGTKGVVNSKYGYYSQSESEEFNFSRSHMASEDDKKTLEAEIMDFADDITFAIHDTEDFYRAGLVPLQSLGSFSKGVTPETEKLVIDIERRWRSRGKSFAENELEALKQVLDLLTVESPYNGHRQDKIDIRRSTSGLISDWVQRGIKLNDTYKPGDRRVTFDKDIKTQITMLKELVWTYVIDRPSLALQQAGNKRIIKTLFEFFVEQLENNETRALPLNFHWVVEIRDPGMETNSRLAADIICSLTDSQALSLYRRITGHELGEITKSWI